MISTNRAAIRRGPANNLRVGLWAHYPMDDASGGAVDVHSGHDLDTPSATPIYAQTGKMGTSIRFEDATANEFIQGTPSVVPTGWPITLNAWARADSANEGSLVAMSDVSASNQSFGLRYRTSGGDRVLSGYLYTSSYNEFLAYGAPLSTDGVGWHMCTFVIEDDNTRRLYVDGVLEATDDVDADYFPTGLDTVSVAALARAGGSTEFDGCIDSVSIWERALTDDDVAALYNGGAGLLYEEFGTPNFAYLLDDGFEGTGNENGYITAGGGGSAVDWNHTTTVGEGAQSAESSSNNYRIQWDMPADEPEVTLKYMWYVPTSAPGAAYTMLQIRKSTGANLFSMEHRDDHSLRIKEAGVTAIGGDLDISAYADGWLYIWIHLNAWGPGASDYAIKMHASDSPEFAGWDREKYDCTVEGDVHDIRWVFQVGDINYLDAIHVAAGHDTENF